MQPTTASRTAGPEEGALGSIGYNDRRPRYPKAKVAELADALDLESSGETRESSSLSFRTTPCALPSPRRLNGIF